MSAATLGLSRVTSGDKDLLVIPRTATAGAGKRGVIIGHGAGADATVFRDTTHTGQMGVLDAVGRWRAAVATDLGGDGWGNDATITKVGQNYTYLTGTLGAASKVHLVGISMGFLNLANWARQNQSKVASLTGIIPVCDLNDMVTNNRGGWASSINTAYSTYSEATHGATHNPTTYAATDLTMPVKLWYASDDTVALAAKASGFPVGTKVSVGALGHTEAAISAVPVADVLAFMAAND